MIYEKVKTIEFEVTTTCNSFCPICVRFHEEMSEDGTIKEGGGVWLNPLVDFNQHLSIQHLRKILSDPYVDDEVSLDFIGTAGDPIAHPKFLEILKVVKELKPNSYLNIHTNGGLKNPKYFTDLAEILSHWEYRYRIRFSIDGLEDTNHIYRIGVEWARVMDNLHAFINAGGRPTWQMVIFPWNEHQVEEVRKYAEEIGCRSFDTRHNISDHGVKDLMEKSKTKFHKTEFLPEQYQFYEDNFHKNLQDTINNDEYIDDQCVSKQGIFVRPEGYVYPCCMFSSASYALDQKALLENAYFDSYEAGWNELGTHNLSEIMDHQWWTDLKIGLDNNKPCDLCILECGASKDESAHYDIDETFLEFGNDTI